MDWLASFRGRMGLTIEDTMVYITGGLALGYTRSGWNAGYAQSAGCCEVAFSHVQVGWVAGVGVEHMFGRNWSIKGELLYYALGKVETSHTFSTRRTLPGPQRSCGGPRRAQLQVVS